MNLRAAAQQALEALEVGDWYIDQLEMIVYSVDDTGTHEERAKVQAAITTLRAALAEPERKPLTDEEIELLAVKHAPPIDPAFAKDDDFIEFARAIERAHGIGGEA